MTRKEMKKEAKEAIISALRKGKDCRLCDIHYNVFNTEYYNNDPAECFQILDSMGGYSVVCECMEYEKDNFGEVCADSYTDPVHVLSLFWYILGDEAMCDFMNNSDPVTCSLWDEELTADEAKELADSWAKMF